MIVFLLLSASAVLGLQVSFFEEFPTNNTLENLALLHVPTKVYLAAHDLEEFRQWRDDIQQQHPATEIIYWPLLPEEAGYWISPWSDTKALEHLFATILAEKNMAVMLDIEVPKKRSLMLRNAFLWSKNKKMIEHFLQQAPQKNITAYMIETTHLPVAIRREIGLAYDSEKFAMNPIRMYYSSFRLRFTPEIYVQARFEAEVQSAAEGKGLMGIGLIAPGIYGSEPRYDAARLQRELKTINQTSIPEAIIFRLAGLDEEYIQVITPFVTKTSPLVLSTG